MNQVVSNVPDTAFMVAGIRALETERPDALFRDPLAAKLLGERSRHFLTPLPGRFVGWSVVIRTVIIDALIQEAIANGVDTILNLGAGLDTRPYRMALPRSLRWIEVDYPHMIELKDTELADEAPNCRLDRVKLDLTDCAGRRRLFDEVSESAAGILILTEGVISYLTEPDVVALADDLRRTDKFRFWIVDYLSPAAVRYGRKMRPSFMRDAPYSFEPEDWFGFFGRQRWRPVEIRYIAEEAERLGRPMPLSRDLKAWETFTGLFTSRARRQKKTRQFAGYALLTPVRT
jgi:methyltransferase (TIGR00027 family)